MDEEQEVFLQSIKGRFLNRLDRKFRAGQKEHGGRLWEKKGISNMAIDEAVDLATYLYTLKDQLDNLHCPECGHRIEVGEVYETDAR